MKSALIVGTQPLFRMAIADLLNTQHHFQIFEQTTLQGPSTGEFQDFDTVVICVSARDSELIDRLLVRPRLCGGSIVLFSEVLGKRHRRLLQRTLVDLCLPLSVHCFVAEKYISRLYDPKWCASGLACLEDPAVSTRFLPDLEDLSNSERVVLLHLQEGLSNRDIAERMNLQLNTVKVHLSSACKKAGFINRTQAALVTHDLLVCGAD